MVDKNSPHWEKYSAGESKLAEIHPGQLFITDASPIFEPSVFFRWLNRNGEKVLQQLYHTPFKFPKEFEWRDVEVVNVET